MKHFSVILLLCFVAGCQQSPSKSDLVFAQRVLAGEQGDLAYKDTNEIKDMRLRAAATDFEDAAQSYGEASVDANLREYAAENVSAIEDIPAATKRLNAADARKNRDEQTYEICKRSFSLAIHGIYVKTDCSSQIAKDEKLDRQAQ